MKKRWPPLATYVCRWAGWDVDGYWNVLRHRVLVGLERFLSFALDEGDG